MAKHKPALDESAPEEERIETSQDFGRAVADLGVRIRAELSGVVEMYLEALSQELRAELREGLEECRRLATAPAAAPVPVFYEHEIPRILHRPGKGDEWVQLRVNTPEACREALAAGWKLRPE